MANLKFRKRLLWILPLVLVGAGVIGVAAMMLQPPPADLDLSLTRSSDHGLYVGTLVPATSPIPVGTIQSWTVVVMTPEGKPIEHASLSIDGGMPQHGHGLPTKPQITEELGGGKYRLEGVKFNMPGWWKMSLTIEGSAGSDSATFNLIL